MIPEALECECYGVDGRTPCGKPATGEDGLCEDCRHDGGASCHTCEGCPVCTPEGRALRAFFQRIGPPFYRAPGEPEP